MTSLTETAPRAAVPGRIGPAAGLRHTMTLAWRSLVQIKHNPMELLDLSVQPIMFLLLFTYVFGGAISGSTTDYLQFSLPGLVVQNMLFATLTTAIGLSTDIHKGVFDRLRSLPIARSAPLAGRIVADTLKQVWAFALFLGLGAVLGYRVQTGVVGVVGALALLVAFALAMSWMSVLIGLTAAEPEKVQIIAFSVMMPLTFTSNAFVPTKTLPEWLQRWVDVNPVTHLADAVRGLLGGGPVATHATISLIWALGIALVFIPLSLRAFRSRA
ncbi:transport permease protein [Sphaerisporangium krabiense]|uniref:Transport permease protein n=1 Tax=Sphaerisporangium krabiense TaxID=763782 RepID=A0A7W9DT34_9ACTN|nr:ABC transporter permease [Sphaerisporangium krabiense]MBB5630367.1 ABC-2 type transport system permease protein/oleandomycin transport system permease protein [Sphaerisporangium krabiense]GII62680.1 transport permease protein [Sphaerisporangium krabiense]